MHELAICRQMLKQVTQIAAANDALSVASISVRIGPLSGVESHLLKQAFPFAASGSVAEKAQLLIESMPVRVRCGQCGSETDARTNDLSCANCGDYHTQLLSGDELLLIGLELSRKNQETTHV